ncbi:MAG: VOC family protein [Alphaproteobacteria bacterium]|nr:VOC family protein [Alphaproteobacteria bacterium]
MPAVKKIPEGYATITPSLVVTDAVAAIALYKHAFGAKEEGVMKAPDGKIVHAVLTIGTSKLFLCDVIPSMCASPSSSSFYLYFEDVDAVFAQARNAGMEEFSPVQDMFWGDRTGCVKDKFGIMWTLATHVRDVPEAEMIEAGKEWMKNAA